MIHVSFNAAMDMETEEKNIEREDVLNMSGEEFEALCAELYSRRFNAEDVFLTQTTKDHGADIVLFTSEGNMLVECKKLTIPKKYASEQPLKQISYAKQYYEDEIGKSFQHMLVATTASGFAGSVNAQARQRGITLHGMKEIEEMMKEYPVTMTQISKRLLKPRLFQDE
jgi:HJR/Mrr/RecB family endonuclease